MSRLWSPAESDALDREVMAQRSRERRKVNRASLGRPAKAGTTARIVDPDGPARGQATPQELARRAAMGKAMRRRARLERDGSRPRQLGNGRWEARRHINGKRHVARFDTQAEAQAWLDSLEGGNA